MRKIFILLVFALSVFSIDLGGFVGEASNARGMSYGVFASLSFFPFTKVEIEGSKYFANEEKQLVLSGEAGISLAGIHPYVIAGVGINTNEEGVFEPLSSATYFSAIGGGIKFSIFSRMLKLRLDFRKFSVKNNPYYRAYVGILFSI